MTLYIDPAVGLSAADPRASPGYMSSSIGGPRYMRCRNEQRRMKSSSAVVRPISQKASGRRVPVHRVRDPALQGAARDHALQADGLGRSQQRVGHLGVDYRHAGDVEDGHPRGWPRCSTAAPPAPAGRAACRSSRLPRSWVASWSSWTYCHRRHTRGSAVLLVKHTETRDWRASELYHRARAETLSMHHEPRPSSAARLPPLTMARSAAEKCSRCASTTCGGSLPQTSRRGPKASATRRVKRLTSW